MQDKKPDLSFFYVFGALCYPTNDNDDLGKLDAKADIGIFVGYAPAKKAFRIYNKRTWKIIETIHVTFDELTITVRSLRPTSVPARRVGLAVKLPSAFALEGQSSPGLRKPLHASFRTRTSMYDSCNIQLRTRSKHFQEAAAPRAMVLADSLVSTSIDQDTSSTKKSKLDEVLQGKPVEATFNHGMIKSLMYLKSNRPSLTYAVCLCAWYQVKPTEKHLHAVKRIFRYLKGTINTGLWYSKDTDMSLTAYADAYRMRCQDIRCSTSRSAQFLGDKLVSWSSKK
nr:uncharacterized mitochondrial protein AtMg00810-like [Tanacetum cinerariifolium]